MRSISEPVRGFCIFKKVNKLILWGQRERTMESATRDREVELGGCKYCCIIVIGGHPLLYSWEEWRRINWVCGYLKECCSRERSKRKNTGCTDVFPAPLLLVSYSRIMYRFQSCPNYVAPYAVHLPSMKSYQIGQPHHLTMSLVFISIEKKPVDFCFGIWDRSRQNIKICEGERGPMKPCKAAFSQISARWT